TLVDLLVGKGAGAVVQGIVRYDWASRAPRGSRGIAGDAYIVKYPRPGVSGGSPQDLDLGADGISLYLATGGVIYRFDAPAGAPSSAPAGAGASGCRAGGGASGPRRCSRAAASSGVPTGRSTSSTTTRSGSTSAASGRRARSSASSSPGR